MNFNLIIHKNYDCTKNKKYYFCTVTHKGDVKMSLNSSNVTIPSSKKSCAFSVIFKCLISRKLNVFRIANIHKYKETGNINSGQLSLTSHHEVTLYNENQLCQQPLQQLLEFNLSLQINFYSIASIKVISCILMKKGIYRVTHKT